jgi:hypothetical protein
MIRATSAKKRAAALLQAHFEQSAAVLGFRNQDRAFFHGVADGFLEIHVFSSAHGLQRRYGVPVVRRGNDHRVDVFPFEQASKIRVDVRWSRERPPYFNSLPIKPGRKSGRSKTGAPNPGSEVVSVITFGNRPSRVTSILIPHGALHSR